MFFYVMRILARDIDDTRMSIHARMYFKSVGRPTGWTLKI